MRRRSDDSADASPGAPDSHGNRGARRGQRGAGSLLVAAVFLLLALVTATGLLVGIFATAQRAAANAADMAALSGAARFTNGGDACQAARQIAAQNGAVMIKCRLSGDSLDFVVSVTVERSLPGSILLPASVTASAHAGRMGPVG